MRAFDAFFFSLELHAWLTFAYGIKRLSSDKKVYICALNCLIDMTKADIINKISGETGVEKAVVLSVVEGFMEQVRQSLIDEENVYLRGFGSFIIKQRATKTARNIAKNTTIIVPAHNIPAFKPAKDFQAVISGKSTVKA